jgi:hypothetical protein
MNKNSRSFSFAALLLLLSLLWISPALGVELSIPEVTTESGKTVEIPLFIDRIDNLAGVKLVMRYDSELLTYKKGVRGEKATSLMHVVNDKNPGRLVVVMAGARGIKGENFPIFTLTFETKKKLKKPHTTTIQIDEIQLMGDDLKNIKCQTKVKPIVITPVLIKTN